ncbi:DUF2827 family protein [Burkholderia sp. BCC1972]|uniref:DUF2827 family protein n=1 Tax=Burkholderia sp. BCC1972 TaxID=2817438 RepID=UPI002ABD681B|nr:DUF2827 family protein [Burkholderia sp. BCC1972]
MRIGISVFTHAGLNVWENGLGQNVFYLARLLRTLPFVEGRMIYRPRSAVHEAGNALGVDRAIVDRVAKQHRWFDARADLLRRVVEAGLAHKNADRFSLRYRSSASFAPSPSRIVPITASIGLRSFA